MDAGYLTLIYEGVRCIAEWPATANLGESELHDPVSFRVALVSPLKVVVNLYGSPEFFNLKMCGFQTVPNAVVVSAAHVWVIGHQLLINACDNHCADSASGAIFD